jgi:NAD(P)-dependent dehydrogenase (short-subunit alcohol dehydrogenase family)
MAFISGASRGIGLALVRRLLAVTESPVVAAGRSVAASADTSFGFYLPVFGVLRSHGNRAAITFWYIVARPTIPEGWGRSPRMRLG